MPKPTKRTKKPASRSNNARARAPGVTDAAHTDTHAIRELRALPDKHPEDLLNNTLFLVMDIGRLYRALFDTHMERFGFKRSEWWLIAHLCFFDGCAQQELADIMDMEKGGMAKLISRLEQRGVIQRVTDALDNRQKRLYFAPSAKATAVAVDNASIQLASNSLGSLKKKEVESLNSLLRTLRESLLNMSQSTPFRRRA